MSMYVSFSWLVGRDAEILKSVTRVNQLKELGMCLFHKLKVAYIVNIIAMFFFFFLVILAESVRLWYAYYGSYNYITFTVQKLR